jgi:DNA-binding transcriptional MerR regulator
MDIGKYKQALSHMLKDDPLKNITFNSEARLVDNDPIGYAAGGRVGFMAGSPNPKTTKLREVLNNLEEGSIVSPTELARQTGAGRKTVYDILNNEYQNKNFNLLGRTAASKKVQENLYNKRMTEKVAYPSPIREGNKIVGVRWPSDETKQMYVNDITHKFSFPKGSLKTISNKDLAKKYFNDISDAAIAKIERINDHLSNELNLEYPKGDINQSAINRRERLEGSQKYLSDFENSILDKQEAIKKVLNKYYQNNPEEILNNEKIKTLIDARLENGKIITTPRYDNPNKYIELAEQGKLFDDFHTSPVKSGKRNIQFPVNKNIGPGKFNQGLMRQIEAYYKNTNNINMPQVIENKKTIDQFLKDYGFRVEIPNQGFIGDKSLAAVNRKTGQLPNIENTLDKLNIPKDIYLNHPDVAKINLKNAEKVFDSAGVTQKEREAVNLINNQLNSGVDPEFIKKLYEKEIDMANNAITKIGRTGANALRTFEDIFISFGRTPGGRALGLAAVAPEIIHSGSAGLRGDYKEMLRAIPTIGTFGLLPETLKIPGTDIDIGKGSTDLDIIKHAKEKGMDSESVKKIIDKNQAANKLDDFIGSRQDYLTLTEGKPLHPSIKKQLDDREKELNKQYNDINVNTSDWKNFAKSVYSFHERNRNRSLSAIQDKDTLNRDVENDYNETFRSLNPDFRKEYNIGAKEEKDNIINVGIGEEGYQSPDEISTGYADGGRVKLEGGGGPKMGRRGFLGLLAGAAAAAPELLKTIKGTSQVSKVASKIKLEPAQGMYSWFPDLVEKIKIKGKPFEEPYTIMEASYKHEARGYGGLPKGEEKLTRHIDGDTEFVLREYPDGRIAVDIHSPRNQEGLDTPVTLYYRPKMELQYHTGKKVDPAEFKVLEKEPRYFANGPDDVDIEMSEKVKIPGRDTIFGDIEAAERFATGDIKNRKVIPTKQSIRNQMEDAPVDFIESHTPYGSYDPPTEILE